MFCAYLTSPLTRSNRATHYSMAYPTSIVSFLSLLAKVRIGAYHTAHDRRRTSSGCMVGSHVKAEQWCHFCPECVNRDRERGQPPLARPAAFQTLQAGSTERNEEQPVTFSARQKTGEVRHGDTTVSGQVWRHALRCCQEHARTTLVRGDRVYE